MALAQHLEGCLRPYSDKVRAPLRCSSRALHCCSGLQGQAACYLVGSSASLTPKRRSPAIDVTHMLAQVVDSAYVFVMGRPRAAAQQAPPPAAESAPGPDESPQPLAADEAASWPLSPDPKPHRAKHLDSFDSCACHASAVYSPLASPGPWCSAGRMCMTGLTAVVVTCRGMQGSLLRHGLSRA